MISPVLHDDGRLAALEEATLGDRADLGLAHLRRESDMQWPAPARWWWQVAIYDVRWLPRLREVFPVAARAGGGRRPQARRPARGRDRDRAGSAAGAHPPRAAARPPDRAEPGGHGDPGPKQVARLRDGQRGCGPPGAVGFGGGDPGAEPARPATGGRTAALSDDRVHRVRGRCAGRTGPRGRRAAGDTAGVADRVAPVAHRCSERTVFLWSRDDGWSRHEPYG